MSARTDVAIERRCRPAPRAARRDARGLRRDRRRVAAADEGAGARCQAYARMVERLALDAWPRDRAPQRRPAWRPTGRRSSTVAAAPLDSKPAFIVSCLRRARRALRRRRPVMPPPPARAPPRAKLQKLEARYSTIADSERRTPPPGRRGGGCEHRRRARLEADRARSSAPPPRRSRVAPRGRDVVERATSSSPLAAHRAAVLSPTPSMPLEGLAARTSTMSHLIAALGGANAGWPSPGARNSWGEWARDSSRYWHERRRGIGLEEPIDGLMQKATLMAGGEGGTARAARATPQHDGEARAAAALSEQPIAREAPRAVRRGGVPFVALPLRARACGSAAGAVLAWRSASCGLLNFHGMGELDGRGDKEIARRPSAPPAAPRAAFVKPSAGAPELEMPSSAPVGARCVRPLERHRAASRNFGKAQREHGACRPLRRGARVLVLGRCDVGDGWMQDGRRQGRWFCRRASATT